MRKNSHSQDFYDRKFNQMQEFAKDKGIEFPFKSKREFIST